MKAEAFLRKAVRDDIPAIEKLLAPWWDVDEAFRARVESLINNPDQLQGQCTILELDTRILCASAWIQEGPHHVKIIALGCESLWQNADFAKRLIQEEILDWAEMGIQRVDVRIPEAFTTELAPVLSECGFIFHGVDSEVSSFTRPVILMSKHFIYKSISRKGLLDLSSLDYGIRRI